MTIAAGFDCANGLVLCADTEVTFSTFKFPGRKVRLCLAGDDTSVVMTGAGSVDSLDYVYELCGERLRDGMSLNQAQDVIAEVLVDLYEGHLYKSPAYQGLADPDNVWVICGLRAVDGTRLLKSHGTKLTPAPDGIALAGGGLELGRYVVDRFIDPPNSLTMGEASVIAVALLAQARRYIQGCGGNSVVVALSKTGHMEVVAEADIIDGRLSLIDEVTSRAALSALVGDRPAVDQGLSRVRTLLDIALDSDEARETLKLHRSIGPKKADDV